MTLVVLILPITIRFRVIILSKKNYKPKATDEVYNSIYSKHLRGGMNNNPTLNKQSVTERMYINVLTELCSNRFTWVGLPDTIDKRFLEMTLLYRSLCIFYFDKDYGRYLALRGSGMGRINMYDNPTSFNVIGNTMVNKVLTSKECVPIWGNYTRTPDTDIIFLYAEKLAELDRSIEISSLNLRQSKTVVTDEDERLSWVNIVRQHEQGIPTIFGTRQMDLSKIGVFDMGVDPKGLEVLMSAKAKIWAECMTLLGIPNGNDEKKERLVAAEVDIKEDQAGAMRATSMNAREQACAQINEMFDLSVSVKFNSDIGVINYPLGVF